MAIYKLYGQEPYPYLGEPITIAAIGLTLNFLAAVMVYGCYTCRRWLPDPEWLKQIFLALLNFASILIWKMAADIVVAFLDYRIALYCGAYIVRQNTFIHLAMLTMSTAFIWACISRPWLTLHILVLYILALIAGTAMTVDGWLKLRILLTQK